MTVQLLLEAHMKNIQHELARQREEVRAVQQQLRQQLLPYPVEEGLGWGLRASY